MRARRNNKVIIIFLFILFSRILGAETWTFSADQVKSSQKKDNPETILTGSARVESEKYLISASYLELSGKDYTHIYGSGGITLTDKERNITISSENFDYDREQNIIKFRELVTLKDKEKDVVIRCESMDYYDRKSIVDLRIAVRLIKGSTICRGEFAVYSMEENHLNISGNPVVWKDGDEYRARRIEVNLDTEEISLEGSVSGELLTGEKEENGGS